MAKKFLVAIDLNKNEIQNPVVHNLAAAPGTPAGGQLYYDTGTLKLYFFNGTIWIDCSGAAVTYGAITAQTTFGASSTNGVATTVARSDHAHGTPVHDAAAHSAIKLSDLAVPTANISINSNKITSLADGTVATDAATYGQILSAVNGFDWKASVRVATTANGTLATAFANGQVIDSVSLVTGDRILLKNQTAGAENGIYVVAASGAPARAADADTSAEVTGGMTVYVNEGTTQADTTWTISTNDAITLGTTALVFAQTAGPGSTLAGTGLTRSGSTLSIATGYQAQKYAADIGDNSSTSITVTHNLNTKDVIATIFDNTTPWAEVEADIRHTSTSALTVLFTTAPTTAQYRIVVMAIV